MCHGLWGADGQRAVRDERIMAQHMGLPVKQTANLHPLVRQGHPRVQLQHTTGPHHALILAHHPILTLAQRRGQ